MTDLTHADREHLRELEPVLRRAVDLDPATVVRLRLGASAVTVLARLPFGVLVGRTVQAERAAADLDVTVAAGEALDWIAGERHELPGNRDADWRGGSPPSRGWTRLDAVPDDVVRGLVRQGALALKDAAEREGVPGAQPRAEVADALLDSVVLTVEGAGRTTELNLRTISALTRMGFLPRGGVAGVDVAGRWTRVAAAYGSVFSERPGSSLLLR